MKSQIVRALWLLSLAISAGLPAVAGAQTGFRPDPVTNYLRNASFQMQDPAFGNQDPLNPSGFGTPEQNPKPAEAAEQPMVITPGMLGNPQDQGLPALPQLERREEPDQQVVVREKYAGWRQAGTERGGAPVESPLRGNWVLIDATGRLSGTVVGNDQVDTTSLPVYLVDRGSVISQTRTNDVGEFSFNNVGEGTYSLVGFGDNAFFAFGFNAIDHKQSLVGKMPDSIRVLGTQNKTTVNLDWIRYFSSNIYFRVIGRHTLKEGTGDPAEFYGIDGISTLAPPAVTATSLDGHDVVLDEAGTLVGRLHFINSANGRPVDVRSARVMLLTGDSVAAATDADNYGVFRFEGIAPGNYSVVAVSADGMGCIGINAVNAGSVPGEPGEDVTGEGSAESGETAPEGTAREGQRIAVDLSLVAPETAGWLNHLATEEAYQRVAGRKIESTAECAPCVNYDLPPTCKKNNGMRNFFSGMNAGFDMMFYGESFQPGYANSSMGGAGMPGCGGCGVPGCSQCQPAVPAPPCGGCGDPNCNQCHPAAPPLPNAWPMESSPSQPLNPETPTPAQPQAVPGPAGTSTFLPH